MGAWQGPASSRHRRLVSGATHWWARATYVHVFFTFSSSVLSLAPPVRGPGANWLILAWGLWRSLRRPRLVVRPSAALLLALSLRARAWPSTAALVCVPRRVKPRIPCTLPPRPRIPHGQWKACIAAAVCASVAIQTHTNHKRAPLLILVPQ
eukprot:scaffold21720_cov126-Isochrysis_galbana.AAC.2